MSKITVYIPSKNRRALLSRAIASVLDQDHRDIELIVVNDCSTDDTRQFLDDLAARERRLIAVHMPVSGGAPAARNKAINMASGAFITGLDDDDEFAPGRLSAFLERWNALQVDGKLPSCLFTPSLMTNGIDPPTPNLPPPTDADATVVYTDLFKHNVIGNQVFCPTAHLIALNGFDESMPAWQDLELFIRLLRTFGPARRVDPATYVCYIDEGRDRISGNHPNRRLAFGKISAKYPSLETASHQSLFLQMFSPFYGLMPTAKDFAYLVRPRLAPLLILKLAKWGLKNAVRNAMRGSARRTR